MHFKKNSELLQVIFTPPLSTCHMRQFKILKKTEIDPPYCACVLYVTLSCQQASATVHKMEILIESSTLIFSAVLNSTPVIFSQVHLKLMRILHDKNYQNWSSSFGEKCLVLFLRSDRYSVPRPGVGNGGGRRVRQGSTSPAPLPLDSTPTQSEVGFLKLTKN